MTTVEWLEKEIENISIQVFDGFLTFTEFMEEREKLCKQAKEMEKQKLIEMHDKGFDSVQQLNDDYAIEFAEWININYFVYNTWDQSKTTKELLEIFKKENGL